MKKGVLYIASGASYIKDAIRSANSIKNNSNLPITIVADREIQDPIFDNVLDSDDFLYHYGDSVLQIPPLPYENTLLLDTDTVVSNGFDDVFEVLNNAEIAAAPIAENIFQLSTVPASFPEFNTGVVLFNRSNKTSEFINSWKTVYKSHLEDGIRMNQPAFREVLYNSSIKFVTLSTEYNCRANFGGYLTDTVNILHGNFQKTEQIFNKLNKNDVPRVFFNTKEGLSVKKVNTTNNRFGDKNHTTHN